MSTAAKPVWRSSRSFGCDPGTPALARAYVLSELHARESSVSQVLRDEVVLVISELVSNAVTAAYGEVVLEVMRDERSLLLAVSDDGPGWPTPQDAAMSDVHGRGLAIVAGIAQEWGIEADGDRKQVWARLAL